MFDPQMNPSRIARFRDDPVIARSAPFLLFIGLLILGSNLSSEASVSAVASWLVVARGAIVALALLWFWPGYDELRKPPPTHPGHWLLAVIVGFGVFLAWIYLDQDWAVLSRSPGFSSRLPGGGTDWILGIARLAGLALVVPVMEELFWRSLVLRWIERHDFLSLAPGRVGIRAFVITTILFALEHDRWFAGAVAGIAYNGLYMRSRNLWVPTVAHIVTNAALGIWVLQTQNWQFW
jgi:CAAX prenyl protease-like protein